jgi:hypothetical protein
MDRMTNHTDDDKFDPWVQGAARDYNRPSGPAPRDAMWAAIEGALESAPSSAAHVRAGDGATDRIESLLQVGRRRRLAPVWWQAAAAILLLAGGIGIGRVWSAGPAGESTASSGERGATSGAGDSALAPTVAAVESQASPQARDAAGATTTPNGRGASPRDAVSGGAGTLVDGASGRSMDVATLQHLSRAEALLTAFRAGDGAVVGGRTSMDRWARDLLADTRLFIDSPAATDARRRQLLFDLELILAQIVQLPAESSADRGLVQRSIERGAVLSRLRSTIPAGYSSGT